MRKKKRSSGKWQRCEKCGTMYQRDFKPLVGKIEYCDKCNKGIIA